MVNNDGSVDLAGNLSGGAIRLPGIQKSVNGSDAGLLKDIRLGSCLNKADIARQSCTV